MICYGKSVQLTRIPLVPANPTTGSWRPSIPLTVSLSRFRLRSTMTRIQRRRQVKVTEKDEPGTLSFGDCLIGPGSEAPSTHIQTPERPQAPSHQLTACVAGIAAEESRWVWILGFWSLSAACELGVWLVLIV